MDKKERIEYWLNSAVSWPWCVWDALSEREIRLVSIYRVSCHRKGIKGILCQGYWWGASWIHDLVRLAEKTTLPLSDEQKQLLAKINDFNIEARYPDCKYSFYKLCTKEFTEGYFTKIKEMYQ